MPEIVLSDTAGADGSLKTFQQAVLKAVRLIPAGSVASYGQIAAYIGSPRAARQVGWAMRSMEGLPDFPWWRVLNNAGIITIKGNKLSDATQQRELLEAEGIEVGRTADGDDYRLDIERYRYRMPPETAAGLGIDPEFMERLGRRYFEQNMSEQGILDL